MHNKHSYFSASETAIATPSAARQQAPMPASTAANPLDIEVSWACHLDEVREAQRLRHQIFAGEMGAQLQTSLEGHDVDGFDD